MDADWDVIAETLLAAVGTRHGRSHRRSPKVETRIGRVCDICCPDTYEKKESVTNFGGKQNGIKVSWMAALAIQAPFVRGRNDLSHWNFNPVQSKSCRISLVKRDSSHIALFSFSPVFSTSASNSTHWFQLRAPSRCETTREFKVYCVSTDKIVGGAQLRADQNLRRLILLRHAKSSWSDRSIKDHERPLSKKGCKAAASIALKLQQHLGWLPQLILCSNSTRTRETLEIMQQHLPQLEEAEVHFLSSFYSVAAMDGETLQHLQEIIYKYSKDDIQTIMCMGHNRGWEEAATLLTGIHVELKTANAALLEATGSSWQEAFENAGAGGWKLFAIVKPDASLDNWGSRGSWVQPKHVSDGVLAHAKRFSNDSEAFRVGTISLTRVADAYKTDSAETLECTTGGRQFVDFRLEDWRQTHVSLNTLVV
ncbi:hypothetical protein R1flu_002573 [Riccia fluitans]|uniref:Uncharacterized protein n=1 Tax=Riccia fluitans TaxID=41844 RepID=A0ABD1Y6S2_9MARC